MDPKFEHFKDFSSAPLSMAEKRKVWLNISDMTEQEFDAMMAGQKERQVRVPKVGTEAPAFRIERLTREKKRTGDYVRLSELRGKPVALLFGSFT